VLVNGDRLGEPHETFVVNLSSPNYGTISDGQGAGTIVDDEPRLSISDVTKTEGTKGQTTLFTFTVTLSTAYDQAVTMSFRTVDGTAKTSDSDYVAKTGTLTFAPGETTKTITIEVTGDGKKTTLFTFTVTLSAAYDQAVTLSFQTVNGTATTSDNDYVAQTGTLTFAPGETTKTINIVVNGDSKKEADETFYLDLFGNSSNSLLTKSRSIGTILNDD
jgi:hypothetical protein